MFVILDFLFWGWFGLVWLFLGRFVGEKPVFKKIVCLISDMFIYYMCLSKNIEQLFSTKHIHSSLLIFDIQYALMLINQHLDLVFYSKKILEI